MNAIFDKEGQFVCVIRNTEIAKARAQEFRGTYEAIEETPGSIPPEFITKTIPGAVIMRAGGVEWVRRQPFEALQSELNKVEVAAQSEQVPYIEISDTGKPRFKDQVVKKRAKAEPVDEESKQPAEPEPTTDGGVIVEKD